jgi:Ca2+-binding EF-hand superfamily protein
MGCGASAAAATAAATGTLRRRRGPPPAVFTVDPSRPGCSAAALDAFAKLKLRRGDVDALWGVFCRMDVQGRGAVELPAFYRFLGVPPSRFADRVFALFDESGDGVVDFTEFVTTVWVYCSLDASALCRFAFMMYDGAVCGHISGADLRDMMLQMWGERYATNARVMAIVADAGFGDRVSYETFADITARYPYLLFPAFMLQQAVRRAVLGHDFWARQYAERTRRGNAALYSVWDVLAALAAARVRADGGEMAVALAGRYVPAHLVGNPDAQAAAEVADDPVRKAQLRRAQLGLPPAAGDPALMLAGLDRDGGNGGSGGCAPTAPDASSSDGGSSVSADGVVRAHESAPDPLAGVKRLQGRAHAVVLTERGAATTGGGGGPGRGRRGSRVANAQERAAMLAEGR